MHYLRRSNTVGRAAFATALAALILAGCGRPADPLAHPASMLIGHELTVWPGETPRIACRAIGPTISDHHLLLIDTSDGSAALIPPGHDADSWATLSNWYLQGTRIMAVSDAAAVGGDANYGFVTLDPLGQVVRTERVRRNLLLPREDPETPPSLLSLAVSADGSQAVMGIMWLPEEADRLQAAILAWRLDTGLERMHRRFDLEADRLIEQVLSPFAVSFGPPWFIQDGTAMSVPDPSSEVQVVSPEVQGAGGSVAAPWTVVWRRDNTTSTVSRFDPSDGRLHQLWHGPEEVLHAELDPTGSNLIVAEAPSDGVLTLHHVDLAASDSFFRTIQVNGIRPGVHWVAAPVVAVADGKRISTIDMASGEEQELWSVEALKDH